MPSPAITIGDDFCAEEKLVMKLVNRVCVLAAMVVLAGCSERGLSPLAMLNAAQPVGSPFNKYLAVEYKTVANRFHGAEADYFAKKGLAAVDGMFVQPETLAGRDFSGVDAAEMAESRGELINLLNGGGRDLAPDISAVAQTRFDCWAGLQGGSFLRRHAAHFPQENVTCREKFRTAVNLLKQVLEIAPPPIMSPPAPVTAEEFPSPILASSHGIETPVREMSFLIFFDWDKAIVTPGADDVLEMATHEINARDDISEIIVGGYTDTSGSEKYNMKLSQKRANAVRERLVFYGADKNKIRVVGHGEKDLLVKTAPGAREPQNRRAQIIFE